MDDLVFQFGIAVLLIALGWTIGAVFERRHLADLAARESANGEFLVTQLKSFPAYAPGGPTPQMVVAEAVIATDYFKSLMGALRRLFGGEIHSYETLLDRARRESTQRVIDQARRLGYNAVCNLRLETADVGGNNSSKKGATMVCILASATAYCFQPTDG